MALGNNYNNKKGFDPMVHSRYQFSNPVSEVDQTKLVPDFWAGNLKLSIYPKKGEKNGISNWDYDGGISIYLSYTKAEMFRREILDFLKSPDDYNNRGVSSGAGMIAISNGKDYGVDCPIISIKILDPNSGEITSEFAYQINKNYHYSIRNFDKNKPTEFSKQYYDFLELDQLVTLLDQYIKNATCAMAYSIIDQGRFNYSRINTKIDLALDKLGVERRPGNKSSSSFFDKNTTNEQLNAPATNYSSMDDIENMIK